MSDLHKAAQQALEALEDHATQYPHMQKGYTVDAIAALRDALAQQAEPAPGWCKHCKQYSIEEPLPAQQAEPVGRVYRYGKDSGGKAWHGIHWYSSGLDLPDGTRVYIAPLAAPSSGLRQRLEGR